MRDAQRQTDRLVGELVDIGDVVAVAVRRHARHDGLVGVVLVLVARGQGALAVGQRAHRLQIDRPGDALIGHARVRGLIDLDLADDFRRVLVVFDRAVVVGAGLFAAVQRGDGEVRPKTPDRQGLGAALVALRRDAGQASDGFGDRGVRQLADVLGGHRLDDRRVLLLGRDGVLNPLADARDHDRGRVRGLGFGVRGRRVGGVRRLRRSAQRQAGAQGGQPRAGQQAAAQAAVR